MAELLTMEEAQRLILERVRPLPAERVPIEAAAGRVLAEPAGAVVDLPPFASSAMDGFALRASETPGTLPVVARIAAGRPAERELREGEAMAIATGGVIPEGADAVIPLEYVVEHDNSIEISDPVARVRTFALEAATFGPERPSWRPAHVSARRSSARSRRRGIAEVACGAQPRAAVLATGTELRRPGEPLAPGEIYEANGLILAAQLASAGALVERLAAVADDEDAHRDALARGLEHDVLVTSGGVSVGPHDLVRRIEGELGVEEVFWRVAVKPGKPVSFGVRGSTLVFGLPGNPVSSLVGFELFVRPAVLALQGHGDPLPRFEPGRLGADAKLNPDRDELVRARTRLEDGAVVLDPLGGQESHMIARAAGADALVLFPRGDGELAAGAPVRYLRLG